MKHPIAIILSAVALMLTAYFVVGGEVRPEGSLGDTYLVVKPTPSLDRYFGGGEDGAWARRNPGEPSPWWQDLDTRPSVYLGDWENGSTLSGTLNLAAVLLMPIAWLSLVVFGLVMLWRRVRLARRQ